MRAISLVEKGWPGVRQLSIPLARRGIAVRHLVRGALAREVLEVITPQPGMTIRGIAPRWYRLAAWLELLGASRRGGLRLVLVDNEKAADWVARCVPWLKDRLVLLQESSDGAPVIARRGRATDLLPAGGGA